MTFFAPKRDKHRIYDHFLENGQKNGGFHWVEKSTQRKPSKKQEGGRLKYTRDPARPGEGYRLCPARLGSAAGQRRGGEKN